MVVEMVPLKGGIGGIVHQPNGSIYHLYTTYILPSGYKWYISGIYYHLADGLCHRSHLLGEPETAIEGRLVVFF